MPAPLGNLQTLLLVDDVSERRLPFMSSLDVRLGKEFAFAMGSYRPRFNVDLDVFNVLNANTVLGQVNGHHVVRLEVGDEVQNTRSAWVRIIPATAL